MGASSSRAVSRNSPVSPRNASEFVNYYQTKSGATWTDVEYRLSQLLGKKPLTQYGSRMDFDTFSGRPKMRFGKDAVPFRRYLKHCFSYFMMTVKDISVHPSKYTGNHAGAILPSVSRFQSLKIDVVGREGGYAGLALLIRGVTSTHAYEGIFEMNPRKFEKQFVFKVTSGSVAVTQHDARERALLEYSHKFPVFRGTATKV